MQNNYDFNPNSTKIALYLENLLSTPTGLLTVTTFFLHLLLCAVAIVIVLD
jgi:hypothetical protein